MVFSYWWFVEVDFSCSLSWSAWHCSLTGKSSSSCGSVLPYSSSWTSSTIERSIVCANLVSDVSYQDYFLTLQGGTHVYNGKVTFTLRRHQGARWAWKHEFKKGELWWIFFAYWSYMCWLPSFVRLLLCKKWWNLLFTRVCLKTQIVQLSADPEGCSDCFVIQLKSTFIFFPASCATI